MPRLPPALRSNILLVWLIAPTVTGVLLSLLTLMPSLFSLFGLVTDHCTIHDGHLHLCLTHPPLPVDNSVFQFALITLLGITTVFMIISLFNLLRAYKLQQFLMMASQPHEVHDIRVVDWDMPLALSAGIWRKQVFISSQLIQTLSKQQLEVVIKHEQTHLRRSDPLRHFVAHTFSFTHIPRLRKYLLADLELAAEQACDEAAAQTRGRLHVADTILAVERLFVMKRPPNMLMSISGSNITARVEALLAQPTVHVSLPGAYMALIGAGALFVALAMMDDIHHFTESILQLITG
ncbi:MAG: M56 family metallopeptidase [Mariprofundus sp.]|nr:M56 family metallopeptidase [Mariprofundus sp.]